MAENKGIMLAKSVQKHAGRAKEKVSFFSLQLIKCLFFYYYEKGVTLQFPIAMQFCCFPCC